eukprot:2301385-Karenia_brevis.AAC.1
MQEHSSTWDSRGKVRDLGVVFGADLPELVHETAAALVARHRPSAIGAAVHVDQRCAKPPRVAQLLLHLRDPGVLLPEGADSPRAGSRLVSRCEVAHESRALGR